MAGVAVHIAMTDYTGEPDLLFFNYNNGQSDTSVAACTHSVNGNGTWQEKPVFAWSQNSYIFLVGTVPEDFNTPAQTILTACYNSCTLQKEVRGNQKILPDDFNTYIN